MAQQQREENSVLFSLKELRRLDDDRQRQEDDERQAKLEAEQRAREEADRRVREEADRRVREEADRVRRAEEERQAREREDQMRLAEAERRARVEGEMRLQEQRMRMEANVQVAHKSPLKLVAGAVAVVVLLGSGVAYKLYSDAEKARVEQLAQRKLLEDAQARAAAENQRLQAQLAEKERQYKAQLAQMEKERQEARTQADKDRIQARIDNLNRGHKRPGSATSAPNTGSANPGIHVRDISDDPLGALPK